MSLVFNFDFSIGSAISGVEPERIGPGSISLTNKGGDFFRRRYTLASGVSTVLSPDGITPWLWFIFNTHATTDVEVAFGGANRMTLYAGGLPIIWTGSNVPSVTATGAEGEIIMTVVAES